MPLKNKQSQIVYWLIALFISDYKLINIRHYNIKTKHGYNWRAVIIVRLISELSNSAVTNQGWL